MDLLIRSACAYSNHFSNVGDLKPMMHKSRQPFKKLKDMTEAERQAGCAPTTGSASGWRFVKNYLLTLGIFIGVFVLAAAVVGTMVAIGVYLGPGVYLALCGVGFLIFVGFAAHGIYGRR